MRVSLGLGAFLPIISSVILAGVLACGSQRPKRWEPYAGCNADQCQSWFEACRAECLNEGTNTVGDCQNQCGVKRDTCQQTCGG